MTDDWIMRQVKLAGEGVGIILNKQVTSDDLGEVELTNGEKISRYDLVLDYVKLKKFREAFQLVNSLKLTMSFYDFECISDWFISLLRACKENDLDNSISEAEILNYKMRLKELM